MPDTITNNWIVWVPIALVVGTIFTLAFEQKLTRLAKKLLLLLIGEGVIAIFLTVGMLSFGTNFAGKFWFIFAFAFLLLSFFWIRSIRKRW